MSYLLKSYNRTPPGGYPYYQGGAKPHKFPSVPVIESQAQQVQAYRQANALPRATFEEALADVSEFQCYRLGFDPKWCWQNGEVDSSPAPESAPRETGGGCRGCGAHV